MVRNPWTVLFPWLAAPATRRPWVGHVGAWSALGAVALWLNSHPALQLRLTSPWPWLHSVWLPTLVAGVLLVGWCIGGMYAAALPRRPAACVPEVDLAWRQALAALRRANVDLQHAAVFLVVGKPMRGLKSLWDTAGLRWTMAPTPPRGPAPLQLIASRGTVFIALSGAERDHAELTRAVLLRLAERRQPYVPVNGVLLVVPFASMETDATAQQACRQAQEAMECIRSTLEVECPITLLISDLDADPACAEWLASLSPEARTAALGQPFPLMPDVEPRQVSSMYAEGTAWFCHATASAMALDQLRIGPVDHDRNRRLVAWLDVMLARSARLARLTAALAPADLGSPPMMTGCYFAATGSEALHQAFVSGAIRVALENQDQVRWATGALQREFLCRSRLRWLVGTAVAAVSGVGVAGVCGWLGQ